MIVVRRLMLAALSLMLLAAIHLPGEAQAQITATANVTIQSRAVAAVAIPHAAVELRTIGVPAPEVREALIEVRTARVPAPEVHLVLTRSVQAVRVHGPIPEFGGFISLHVRDGLRGPHLYEVIEVEHRRRGHPGRGRMKGHHMARLRVDHGYGMGMGMGMGMGSMGSMGSTATVRIQGGGPPHGNVRVRSQGMMSVRIQGGGHPTGRIRVQGPSASVRISAGGMGGMGGSRMGGMRR